MSYVLPTISDFKGQFVRDFPFATPLNPSGVVGAQLSVQLNSGGSISSIAVVSGGSGYSGTATPKIIIYGGGGIGAQAVATVVAGAISTVTVTNGGYGYQSVPQVYVGAGGDDTNTEKVTDADIALAYSKALAYNSTQNLFGSQIAFTIAYNLLAAHYLCETLIAGGLGLNGKAEWLTNSKTVGNVTESFSIPDRILKSPILAKFSKTTYGAQFLEMVSPLLIGNFQSFYRPTAP